MSVMKSANVFAYDAEAGTLLRADGAAAVTTNTNGAGVALDALSGAYWDNGEIPLQGFQAIVNVTAADDGNADETYVMTVEVDSASDFSDSPVVVATLTIPRGTAGVGFYKIGLDGDTLAQLDGNAAYIREVMTVGGTTPSITYSSWLYKPVH